MATADDAKLLVAQEIGVVETEESYTTLLNETQLIPENAIPTPTILGEVFKKRYERARKLYKDFHDDWKAAIRAFEHDGSIGEAATDGVPKENYVRWIVQTLLEYTYMQNPTAEFTANDGHSEDFARALSVVVTSIVNKANGIGLNLRPYVLKAIVMAYLSNYGVLKINFIDLKGSRQDATALYEKAVQELQAATEVDKVEQLQAVLDRLYKEMQTREDFGINIKAVSPFNFFIDPDATMDDLSDAKWTMELDFIDEADLQTRYMQYNEEEQAWFLKYKPDVMYQSSAIVDAKATVNAKEAIIEELMPDATDDERDVSLEGKVPCIWVYDRTTRKIYLYIKERWDTPIWVFEDELQLSRFFHHFVLAYSPALRNILRFSEVSYVLPFQQEVNDTNAQWSLLRRAAFNMFTYDASAVDKAEIDKVFDEAVKNSTKFRSVGVKLKDNEKTLTDVVSPMLLPIIKAQPLLENNRYEKAIGRSSRVSAGMGGQEFKTNTTNQAIENYENQVNNRAQSFVDPIEEFVAQIEWAIAEIVVSKIDKDSLLSLVSIEHANNIKTMTVKDFNQQFTMQIEAGSIEKPNSQNKKKEAVQIIQMLGQFGTAAPRTVLSVVTRMLRTVFSRSLVTDEDLQTLKKEGDAFMQKGISIPQEGQPK